MTKKSGLTLWTFKFTVRAASSADALRLLKDVTNISIGSDHSDRKINGLHLVQCLVDDRQLTKEFYQKIKESPEVAIHSDLKSASLYPKILQEAQAIEEQLRWLLLHASDAIDDFAEQFSKKNNPQKKSEIITKKSLDPITSTLTFEAMLELLKLDQSWARDGVTVDQMRALMGSSSDFDSFKKSYLDNTTKRTIWDSISALVLQSSVKWETLEGKLNKIRVHRNACAHFRTVTDDDLSQAQCLRKELDAMLAKKKTVSRSDFNSLRTLNDQLAQTLKTLSQTYTSNINTSALTALSSQIDTLKLSHSMQKIIEQSLPTDAILRATANMIPRLDIPAPSQTLIDSINKSIGSMHGLYGIGKDNNIELADTDTEDIKESDDGKGGDRSNSNYERREK